MKHFWVCRSQAIRSKRTFGCWLSLKNKKIKYKKRKAQSCTKVLILLASQLILNFLAPNLLVLLSILSRHSCVFWNTVFLTFDLLSSLCIFFNLFMIFYNDYLSDCDCLGLLIFLHLLICHCKLRKQIR